MAAATTTIPTAWCAAATASCRWMSTCRAARRRPKASSTASCSCRRRSGGRGPSCVADTIDKGARLLALGEAVRAALPDGVVQSIEVERGDELVLRIRREALLPAMTLLRDGEGF